MKLKQDRRNFLKTASIASAGAFTLNSYSSDSVTKLADYSQLDKILEEPVLKRELFPDPVIIETLELLRFEDNFLCRVRSTDGAEGISA